MGQDVRRDAVPLAAVEGASRVGGGDGGGAVVALLKADVAVGAVAGVVRVDGVGVLDLELDPGGRLEVAALDVAFPGQGELDGDGLARIDEGGEGGGCPLAGVVGVILVEVEGLGLGGFVF